MPRLNRAVVDSFASPQTKQLTANNVNSKTAIFLLLSTRFNCFNDFHLCNSNVQPHFRTNRVTNVQPNFHSHSFTNYRRYNQSPIRNSLHASLKLPVFISNPRFGVLFLCGRRSAIQLKQEQTKQIYSHGCTRWTCTGIYAL